MTDMQAGRQGAWMQRFREGSDSYRAWLPSIFTGPRAVRDCWHESFEDEPEVTATEWCFRVGALCSRSGVDLIGYSDEAVGNGLWCLFSPEASALPSALRDGQVDRALRHAALSSIKLLYANCLEQRCSPVLGHLDQNPDQPLTLLVYMLWDISGLSIYHPSHTPRDDAAVVLDVLAATLDSPNIACVESGLHGLSHFAFRSPETKALVGEIIDPFLGRRQDIPQVLRAYAQAAKLGYCQ